MRLLQNKVIKKVTLFIGLLASAVVAPCWAESTGVEKGKALTFDRKKGNCLSCHVIAGGTLMGTTAPPLIQMQARFPDKEKLYDQIWDARKRNPNTIMPPFGSHGMLSNEEVDAVVEYLYTL
ncbi:MAG: sulfur oxidation c-type cytochrome SoxX [Gammaproteobacteria bacterium]|nr:sulfur oxidation c-type cytochrome SoxX [Gammaproteobacteria bacterium]MBQ0839473.1 sulfur oxidation c-type cytochrome SoxX [Gammaproteobacteria bacterium]